MVTADHTAQDSQGAGGCAHLPVQAGEGRAVPAQRLGAGGNSPSGLRPASAAGSGEATRRPRSAQSRRPAPPLRLRTGRPSPASADREDVGGPRAPPRPKNDLGKEVTCAPGPRCGCSQRGRGGGENGRFLPRRGRVFPARSRWALGVTAGVSRTPAPLRRAFAAAAHLEQVFKFNIQ
ncbi:translation initiation factor IF-2-like [Panthera pardus]|uniref:Translation initiation factor IF-2-like n=1 Tax=Panthera pardus TaxID=9691 RepID=A0A9W2VLE4_PANPR|nr:translation initiation factor IF-2-like [Panthera pardus]